MALLSTSFVLLHPPCSCPLVFSPLLRSITTRSLSKRRRVFCSQGDQDSSPLPATAITDETRPPPAPATHHHQQSDLGFSYASASAIGIHDPNVVARPQRSAESAVERVIFDFRFLALLAVGGSLAGSVLCFLNGCVYIVDAYKVYLNSCMKGIHSGQMVLRLVEAIDVYLAGTVMLIFGMGLYGLFISNVSPEVPGTQDRALKGSSLFGMFALKVLCKYLGGILSM